MNKLYGFRSTEDALAGGLGVSFEEDYRSDEGREGLIRATASWVEGSLVVSIERFLLDYADASDLYEVDLVEKNISVARAVSLFENVLGVEFDQCRVAKPAKGQSVKWSNSSEP